MRRRIDGVRVHEECSGQLTGGARELAEHQHTAVVVPSADEFLRDQIHTVVKTADVAQIRGTQESVYVLWLVMRVQQQDRTVAVRAEAAVDTTSRFKHLRSDLAVGWETIPARLGNLHEHEPFPELRVRLEQLLDRKKLLAD